MKNTIGVNIRYAMIINLANSVQTAFANIGKNLNNNQARQFEQIQLRRLMLDGDIYIGD